jgi:hypothetical protein
MPPARHSSAQASSVIKITGIGDHDQPDWLIRMTGIRTLCAFRSILIADSVGS